MLINLYVFDTNRYSLEELLGSNYLINKDIDNSHRFKCEMNQKENLGSSILKNKYIGEYYLSDKDKPLSPNIYFNISHSKGVVILAVSKDNDVGVDIEYIRPLEDKFKQYVCNEDEYLFSKNNDERFYEIWTNKESLLKCLGSGITSKLKEVPGLLCCQGSREYLKEHFMSVNLSYENYKVSITSKGDKPIELDIKQLSI